MKPGCIFLFAAICLFNMGCTQVETIGFIRDSGTDTATSGHSTDSSVDTADSSTADETDSHTGDPPSTDTHTDTATETTLLRIDFRVPDNAQPEYLWVDGATNDAGLQGQWFYYRNELSTNTMRHEGGGVICARGEVAPYTGTGWTFAGIGFNLCNNGPYTQPFYEVHNLANCPLIPDLERRFVGVSFTIAGFPLPGIEVQFKNPANISPPYYRLFSAGRGDYTFAGATIPEWVTDAPIEETNSIQFHVTTLAGNPIPFDFCVSDVQILLLPSNN